MRIPSKSHGPHKFFWSSLAANQLTTTCDTLLLSARPLASNPFMLCPIYASSGHLVFSSFGQICFGIWTNTVFNLDKYIWQFGQSGLHSCWVVSTQPLVSGHPLLSLTDLTHTRQYLRLSNWKSDSLREEILATNTRNIIRRCGETHPLVSHSPHHPLEMCPIS